MPLHLPVLPPVLYALASIAGAVGVLTWRVKETQSAVTVPKLIIPPLGMSTGLFMFLAPQTRVPWAWAVAALALGALVFAVPLARTSKLTKVGHEIRMQRSRAFLVILLGLIAVRFALRAYIEQYVSPLQTGALFFLLALGAIARWRVAMLLEYRALQAAPARGGPET